MNNSTIKPAVEFGEKVSFYCAETPECSTAIHIDEATLIKSFSCRYGAYSTVDYSNEKRMETYRKVNKMLCCK